MRRLQRIDITKVLAVRTDDFRADDVYYQSFVNCGEGGMSGNSPGSYVPTTTLNVTAQPGAPLTCPQGVEVVPPAAWGRLFPTHADHELCCEAPQGSVSGPIFFFDADDSDTFWKIFGVVFISLLSMGAAIGVGLATAPAGPGAVIAGAATGMAVGAGLSLLWGKFVRGAASHDYLGGIRISFPCQSDDTIVQTHELQGASNGIRTAARPGFPAAKYSPSSAQYRITFEATYG